MPINLNFVKFNTMQKIPNQPKSTVSFKASESMRTDTFEKCSETKCDEPEKTYVCKGEIFDRKTNKPIKITVMKSSGSEYETTYHFMSQNQKKEYGYVAFTLCKNPKCHKFEYDLADSWLFDDYPEYGIKGSRIIVDFLRNHNDKRYKGIGKLADKMAVKHCLDNNIKPVIISEADWNSHAAHYKRGKRFLPVNPDRECYKFYLEKYGTANVNEILERMIKESEITGEKIDIHDWYPMPMYLPQELAQKYAKELQSKMK